VAFEVEILSALVGDIYDAALNPDLWGLVLGKIAAFVGGPAASLFSKDAASKTGGVVQEYGIDPHYRDLYFERYIKLDPATTAQYFAEIGEPISTADLIPYDEFLETRFYREWAAPQHFVDFASTVLDRSPTGIAMFGVFRHERDGLVDEETRRRVRLLTPHIRRAALIGSLIDRKGGEAASLADALDGLAAGMFLIDAGGRIAHANAAGHAMLSDGGLLRAPRGRLVVSDAEADRMLAGVLAASPEGDRAVGTGGVAVPMVHRSGERYIAHVLPLTAGLRRRASASYAAVAALFVHPAALPVASPPAPIAKVYKLTPTELRVLLAIVEVGGVPEVAEALGVAESTVKSHLGRVYEKTGANRQADLVKLVAGFASPFRS
jgi:DNA-binding CsgD family transcriptional regulator